jgi:plasmid stabilization system protein ParE
VLAGRPDLMANVIICSAAEVDYTESLTWYAARSVDAANDGHDEFDQALTQITADPERFPLCDVRHRYFLLRRFPFRIIYRMVHDDVVVIAVAHGSRSPDYWADR